MSTFEAISEICRKLLDENRGRLNAEFLQRKRAGAKIDDDAWLLHLQRRVLPLVDRVHHILPERGNRTLNELYDVSLDLFAGGHFAETTGMLPRVLAQLWEQSLPRLVALIARDPRRVSGSLSNAVLAIAQTQPSAVHRWLAKLDEVGPGTESVDHLLLVGQVAAWVAGLPQYRLSAIGLAEQLPTALAQKLLGISESLSETQVRAILQRWSIDCWTDNRDAESINNEPRIEQVALCGSFRGFGGQFLYPPQVFVEEGQLHVTDTQHVWRLQADRFGNVFHRSDSVAKINKRKPAKDIPQINADGMVQWQGTQSRLTHLTQATSQAYDGRTLAVTLPDSFHVYLITHLGKSGGPTQ